MPQWGGEGVTPYYRDELVVLYHADARKFLLSELPSTDVVITDPPYNCGKNYGDTTDDNLPWPDWCDWFDGMLNLCKTCAPNVFAFLSQTAAKKYERLGRHERDWCLIWNKPLSLSVCAAPFMPHWEPIFYWGQQKRTTNGGALWGSDVLTCNVEIGTARWGHPTPKPLALMLEFVSRFDPSWTILDPFSGSGTTLAACKQLGRKAIGVEISEAYCKQQARRLEATTFGLSASFGQPSLIANLERDA